MIADHTIWYLALRAGLISPLVPAAMFTLTVLGSGSAGNCALITTEHCRLLIDAGLSARQIVSRLEALGVAPETLDGILLTHEHGDHAGGLEVLCRKWREVPIYCNAQTAAVLRNDGVCLGAHRPWRIFATGSDFTVGDLGVETFAVSHDAVDPVGFMFHRGRAALGYLTDLGFATKLVHERVRAATTLVIETNHDTALLNADTKRPWSVKQRITSRHGHLSNEAAAAVVAELLASGAKLRRAILGHLSRDCNRPELAVATMRRCGAGDDPSALEIVAAAQSEVSAVFSIEEAPLAPRADVVAASVTTLVAEESVASDRGDRWQLDLFGAAFA